MVSWRSPMDLRDFVQPDARIPVPRSRETGFGVGVPLLGAVDVLEADQRARLTPVGDAVDRNLLERRAEMGRDLRDGQVQSCVTTDSRDEIRFAEQADGRETPVSLQHHEVAVRSFHDHERLDIQVSVGGHRLEKLVELGAAVEFSDQRLFGTMIRPTSQARILAIQPKAIDRDLGRRFNSWEVHRSLRVRSALEARGDSRMIGYKVVSGTGRRDSSMRLKGACLRVRSINRHPAAPARPTGAWPRRRRARPPRPASASRRAAATGR